MANFELKEGQGTLFVNDHKEKESQPDLNGNIMIDGKVYRLAGWKKVYGDNKVRLSLKAELPKPAEQPQMSEKMQEVVSILTGDKGQDLPF